MQTAAEGVRNSTINMNAHANRRPTSHLAASTFLAGILAISFGAEVEDLPHLSFKQGDTACSVDVTCNAGTCVNQFFLPCSTADYLCSCSDINLPSCSTSSTCGTNNVCVNSTLLDTSSTCLPCSIYNTLIEFFPTAVSPIGDNPCADLPQTTLPCSSTQTCPTGTCVNSMLSDCTKSDAFCRCLDANVPVCSDSDACPNNNNCVSFDSDDTPSVCVPCPYYNLALQLSPGSVFVEGKNNCNAPLSPLGLDGSLVTCRSDSNCDVGSCVNTKLEPCTTKNAACACFNNKMPLCSSSDNCEADSVCVTTGIENTPSLCLPCSYYNLTTQVVPGVLSILGDERCDKNTASTEAGSGSNTDSDDPEQSPDGSPEDDPVCVDSDLLSHLQLADLVFSQHRRASVLCDVNGSCATPGHIVLHKGNAMMMQSYCRRVSKCTTRVMHVNSPRMNGKIRVSTKTSDLSFTAFAARYQSTIEEAFLSTIVHAGF